jgi:type II secretory pathway pseudopilin PulG
MGLKSVRRKMVSSIVFRPFRACGPDSKAFTQLGLPMVIAVIGILAALLLPALGRTKFWARVVNCTSDFRQWTLEANAQHRELATLNDLDKFFKYRSVNHLNTSRRIGNVLKRVG